MWAPAFWNRAPGPLLSRIGPLAPGRRAAGARARGDGSGETLPVPVVSVGALSLGGTGKTPAVIALAQRLASRGRTVHVVTRGRGAPLRVDERGDDARMVGDEPLLLAAFAPTWTAADAVEGVLAAARDGAEVVVLDAGTALPPQGVGTHIHVEDAARGFGNGFAWPLGPLAAPLATGHAGVDLLLAVGTPRARARFARDWAGRLPCPVVGAGLEPLPTGVDWRDLDVIAFAGIGAPERFFATLSGLGANIIRAQALDDHQDMTPALMSRLVGEARRAGAQLVTTEKDAVRLPQHVRQEVISLPVRLEPEDWTAIDALLR